MLSNKKLYTLDAKQYQKGEMDRNKLVVNMIDIEFLSHIIFFPEFEFEMYKFLDIKA